MLIVNIRDDDGDIVDTLDIPVSQPGGSSGDYAPAKAIVEVSPYHEKIMREDFGIIEWWEWERYVDGTFMMRTSISVGFSDGCLENEMSEPSLPFDVYDISCSYYADPDGCEALKDVEVNIFGCDDMLEYRNEMTIYAIISEDAYNNFVESGVSDNGYFEGRIDLTITGKWRED